MRSAYLAAELTLCLLCAVVPDVEPQKSALKAEAEPVVDLTGIYSVSGNDGEKDYGGCCLVIKAGAGYLVAWHTCVIMPEGVAQSSMRGTGLLKGDTLSVAWGDSGKGNGITVYAVAGKRLVGEWAQTPGLGRRNKETLTRLAGLPGETQ
jgi:hypothetical protein